MGVLVVCEMIWSKERERRLRELRAAGISFDRIAKEFNVTKNAIAGKCGRMGLCRKAGYQLHMLFGTIAYMNIGTVQQPRTID